MMTENKPTVLFLCTHNAGRSQMALGFFNHLAGDRAVAWSGGSEPAAQINPAGMSVDAVRPIRDEIEERVRRLFADLGVAPLR